MFSIYPSWTENPDLLLINDKYACLGSYSDTLMRVKALVSLVILVSFLFGGIPEAGALSIDKVTFRGAGVVIDLTFPEEAHPTETISHNLTITAYTSLELKNFTLVIRALVDVTWQQVYKEQMHLPDMRQNESLTRRIMFTLPQNAYERLYCYVHVLTDKILSDPLTYTFYSTHVGTMTYSELLREYDELFANYSTLYANYEALVESYNTFSTQYGALNSTYASLLNQYNSLQESYTSLNSSLFSQKTNYDALKVSYDSLEENYKTLNQTYHALKAETTNPGFAIDALNTELTTTRILLYSFVAVIVALMALIVYIKKKKPEPYIVVRKETVALKPTENPQTN